MRSRRQADERTERYPVLADEPVEVRRPRRKVRLIAASFAATIVLAGGAAYAGTAYAIERADSDLQHSRDQFANDLEQRRREREREQAAMNKDLCTVVTRLPADPDTDAMRRKYGCGPFVEASPDTPPAPPPGLPSKARTSSGGTPPLSRPRTGPTPTSAPAPPPHASPPAPPAQPTEQPDEEPGDLLRLCLPLLGCVVV
jgi:hypothetical protein